MKEWMKQQEGEIDVPHLEKWVFVVELVPKEEKED